jgi:predicted transcriptional regulator
MVYRMPTMSGRRKWTYETFKDAMDAIENINVTLRKASRLWNIPLNSLFNILNGKTRTKKVGVKGTLIAREDVGILTSILTMHKVGLSINIQQLKQKVAKIT